MPKGKGSRNKSIAKPNLLEAENDLAIAAITLSVKGTLVTRNVMDFQRVPGLVFEDWSK